MQKHSKKTLLINTFGTMGYIFCLALWGWTGMLYLPMILASERVGQLLLPAPGEDTIAPVQATEMSPATIIFALIITAVIMLLTVIALLRAPIAIARTGKSVTTKAASSALPLITRGHLLPAAEKRRLTAELVKLAKLLLILLPIAIGFLGAFIEPPLPFDLSILISSLLALCAVLWFSLQYITARILAVDAKLLV